MKLSRLFTPGPVEVPRRVLDTMSRPLIHHRTEEFRKIHGEVLKRLQLVMRSENPVVLLTASGSGAMDAAVANLTSPGEKVLVTYVGKFSERWVELAKAYGLDVVTVEAEWGDPVEPEKFEQAMKDNPGVKVVFTTHSETSTGVLQNVEAFSTIAHKHGALIVVDGITSLCSEVVATDAWKLDAVIGGSQKGFMIPPGLSFLSLSEAARKRLTKKGHATYYFDLKLALKSLEKGDTPWTPAISLVIALNEALAMLHEEGLENVIARHSRNAHAVRSAVEALGLELFSSAPTNCTTAVLPPEGTADKIRNHLDKTYGIKIAGGQGKVKGKIFRLGHLGHYDEVDMYTLIAFLEAALRDLGMNDTTGRGLEALAESYRER